MLDLLEIFDRLQHEAAVNRRYEGFLRDLSSRKGPGDIDLWRYLSDRYFNQIARTATLQIEAVEAALVIYVARVWENYEQKVKQLDKKFDALSLPNIRILLSSVVGSSEHMQKFFDDTKYDPRLSIFIESRGEKAAFDRLCRYSENWISRFDSVFVENKGSIEKLTVLRHEVFSHSLAPLKSHRAKEMVKAGATADSFVLPKREFLDLAQKTGGLIDELNFFYSSSTSSDHTKFSSIDGEEYWPMIIAAIEKQA